ncbi:MAG: hypothetical protein IJ736_04860 [Firmicutes bacterium]|nr:hypothetical protein [Bacillota bacterium]
MRLAFMKEHEKMMLNVDYICSTPEIAGVMMNFYSFAAKIHISLMCHDDMQAERLFRKMLTEGCLDITERMINIDNNVKTAKIN